MSEIFEKTFHVGWGDVDFNGHMGNTSYLDLAVDVRMFFFAENGFPISEFRRLGFGPVVLKDEIEYYKELYMLDRVRITLQCAGLREDATRFRLRNEFYRADGRLAARLTTNGGWLDFQARKLTAPPDKLADLMRSISRADDFEVLPPSVKS